MISAITRIKRKKKLMDISTLLPSRLNSNMIMMKFILHIVFLIRTRIKSSFLRKCAHYQTKIGYGKLLYAKQLPATSKSKLINDLSVDMLIITNFNSDSDEIS
jgi:hypothetical protein